MSNNGRQTGQLVRGLSSRQQKIAEAHDRGECDLSPIETWQGRALAVLCLGYLLTMATLVVYAILS
jgi:hypothetical protein